MASAERLAADHHRKVELIADTVARRVAVEAKKATVGDIDAWWARRSRFFEGLVAEAFDMTARQALQWLADSAALVGIDLEPVAAALLGEQLTTSLRVVGPVGFKTALARVADEDKARQVMAARLAGTTRRLTLAGSRDTLFATADAEPDALIGYRREPESGACKFCLMLASRGAVYLSAERASTVVGRNGRARGTRQLGRSFHDNCQCKVHPVWGRPTGRRVAQPPGPQSFGLPPSIFNQFTSPPPGPVVTLESFGLT